MQVTSQSATATKMRITKKRCNGVMHHNGWGSTFIWLYYLQCFANLSWHHWVDICDGLRKPPTLSDPLWSPLSAPHLSFCLHSPFCCVAIDQGKVWLQLLTKMLPLMVNQWWSRIPRAHSTQDFSRNPNFTDILSRFYTRLTFCYKIFHMPWQLCCHGMFKI